MRTKRLIILGLLTALSSCEVLTPDFGTFIPDGDHTAFVRKTNVISHTSTQVTFDVEFQIVEGFLAFDYGALFEEDLQPDQNTIIENFEAIDFDNAPADEIILLVDQSQNYDITDPHNARGQVINKFAHDYLDNDLMIGGLSSNGLLTAKPIEYLPSSDADEKTFTKALIEFATRTGGESNLYDALYAALDNFGSSGVRHLVVLVQSADQSSAATVASVIAKANSIGVSIDFIALGENAPVDVLSAISQQTGGFFAACNSDKEMISMFNNLNRILNGFGSGYKARLRWTPGVAVSSGLEFVHPLETIYFYDNTPFNKIYSFIKIP